MILHLVSFLFLSSFLSTGYSKDLMNSSMLSLQRSLESKCSKESLVLLSKELFEKTSDYENFVKQLDELLISRPANACDLLKHAKILSLISALPQLSYSEKEVSQKTDYLKKMEVEHSRKYYISKILELKESFSSIEKESINKKRALDSNDFYLKGLLACIESSCPYDILQIISDKIPKKSNYIVYDKKIKEIFLEENNLEAFFRVAHYANGDSTDLTYNNSSAMKNALLNMPSTKLMEELKYLKTYYPDSFAILSSSEWSNALYVKEKLKKSLISLNELSYENFQSKNVIGFALAESFWANVALNSGGDSREMLGKMKVIQELYNVKFIFYAKPDWGSNVITPIIDELFKKKEIEYEQDYLNVYGVVNSEKGNWFMIKDTKNKEFWVNKSQFYRSESISTILTDSQIANRVEFFESPAGTKAKRDSSEYAHVGFQAKSFKWIKDQLWILIGAINEDVCEGEPEAEEVKKKLPIENLWIKAFKDDGDYNFLHASRGC